MKNFLSLFIFFIFAFLPFSSVYAGGTETHGGHVVICKKKSGKISSAELLDLYEARQLYGIHSRMTDQGSLIREDWGDWEYSTYLARGISYIKRRSAVILGKDHAFLQVFPRNSRYMHLFTIEGQIEQTKDWGRIQYPIRAGCQLEQIATWEIDSKNKIKIGFQYDYWKYLDPENKLALILHEVFHSWFGHSGSTEATRQAVIFLSAPRKFREQNADLFIQLVDTKKPITSFRY